MTPKTSPNRKIPLDKFRKMRYNIPVFYGAQQNRNS